VPSPRGPLWWPHDHGSQPRYVVQAKLGDAEYSLTTGLRSVGYDDGLTVNGEPVRARGVTLLDPTVEDIERAVAEALRRRKSGLVVLDSLRDADRQLPAHAGVPLGPDAREQRHRRLPRPPVGSDGHRRVGPQRRAPAGRTGHRRVRPGHGRLADAGRRRRTDASRRRGPGGEKRVPHRGRYITGLESVLTLHSPVDGCVRGRHGIRRTTIFNPRPTVHVGTRTLSRSGSIASRPT